MKKPKCLDLFCGAGGVTRGLQQAGFYVVGVDLSPQPRYCGDEFHQADALDFPIAGYDFIWASPPCQKYCSLKTMKNARKTHPDLIGVTRDKLRRAKTLWVIENVFGAPLLSPIMLCGSFFGLGAHGYHLRRHRYFESNVSLFAPSRCWHNHPVLGVYGSKVRDIAKEKRHYALPKYTRGRPVGVVLPNQWGRQAMGINWMNMHELSEAIPPAYSKFIGEQIIRSIFKNGR